MSLRNGIPRFNKVKSHTDLHEPLFKNLFQVSFVLPEAILNRDTQLMLENCTKLDSGETTPAFTTPVVQRYLYSTRVFTANPTATHVPDIALDFQINLSQSNQVLVYDSLADWYDQIHNTQTGELQLKRDYVGEITLTQFDRRGDIYSRIVYRNAFIQSLSNINTSDWSQGAEIHKVTGKFMADYFDEFKRRPGRDFLGGTIFG